MNPLLVLYNLHCENRRALLERQSFDSIANADMVLIVENEYFYVAKNRWGKDMVVVPIGLLGLFAKNPYRYGSLL